MKNNEMRRKEDWIGLLQFITVCILAGIFKAIADIVTTLLENELMLIITVITVLVLL